MKNLLSLIFLCLSCCLISYAGEIPDDELKLLNEDIRKAPAYQKSLRSRLNADAQKLYASQKRLTPSKVWELSNNLSSDYRLFNADSAIKYATFSMRWASAHNLPYQYQLSKLTFVRALATAGLFPSAVSVFESISSFNMPRQFRIEYFTTGRMLYSYLRTYVDGQNTYYDRYTQIYREFDDSLLQLLPSSDKFARFIYSERLIRDDKTLQARKELTALLKHLSDTDNLYGMTAYQLAITYRLEGDETQYARYLATAASSDIKRCVCEGVALPQLAEWLRTHNRVHDAFKYVNFALDMSMKGNSRMRTVSIAAEIPSIDAAYQKEIQSSRNKIIILFVTSLVVLALCLIFVWFLIRSIKQARKKELEMRQIDKVRNSYITSFIALCSNYAKRLESLSKLVSRKISSGQSQELLKLVESGRFSDLHDDEFYKTIDMVILNIFPGFIEQLNLLLKAEHQITLKSPDTLTPELRIYAFVRLGIDESTRIAQILNLSPNTVYAYRNRMRNKALKRDTFDADIRTIGTDNDEQKAFLDSLIHK